VLSDVTERLVRGLAGTLRRRLHRSRRRPQWSSSAKEHRAQPNFNRQQTEPPNQFVQPAASLRPGVAFCGRRPGLRPCSNFGCFGRAFLGASPLSQLRRESRRRGADARLEFVLRAAVSLSPDLAAEIYVCGVRRIGSPGGRAARGANGPRPTPAVTPYMPRSHARNRSYRLGPLPTRERRARPLSGGPGRPRRTSVRPMKFPAAPIRPQVWAALGGLGVRPGSDHHERIDPLEATPEALKLENLDGRPRARRRSREPSRPGKSFVAASARSASKLSGQRAFRARAHRRPSDWAAPPPAAASRSSPRARTNPGRPPSRGRGSAGALRLAVQNRSCGPNEGRGGGESRAPAPTRPREPPTWRVNAVEERSPVRQSPEFIAPGGQQHLLDVSAGRPTRSPRNASEQQRTTRPVHCPHAAASHRLMEVPSRPPN